MLTSVGAAVYVGDTPADMAAAVTAGARPVGVATGSFTGDELRAAGRSRHSDFAQGVFSSLPVTCDLTLVTLRQSQRVLRSGKVPLVSSVLERLGSATPREGLAKNRLLIVGIVAFVVVLGGWLIYAFTQPTSSTLWPVDLAVYRDGGLIVRQLGPYNAKLGAQPYPLYDWTGAGNLNFTYTPFAALFFAAVSFIPWSVLPRVVQVANLIFLFIAAWCTMGALGYRDRRVRLGGALLGVAAGLLTEPVFRTLYLGQINLLLMAAIIWDLRQPDTRRFKGIATGLAAGIKLIPLVFIPYLLLTRKWRAAAVATGSFAFTIVLGFAHPAPRLQATGGSTACSSRTAGPGSSAGPATSRCAAVAPGWPGPSTRGPSPG